MGDGGVMVGVEWGSGGGARAVFLENEKTDTLSYPRLSIGAQRAAVMDWEVLGFIIRIRIG